MEKMPDADVQTSPKDLPEIKKGFHEHLNSRYLPAGIKNYINSTIAFNSMQDRILCKLQVPETSCTGMYNER